LKSRQTDIAGAAPTIQEEQLQALTINKLRLHLHSQIYQLLCSLSQLSAWHTLATDTSKQKRLGQMEILLMME